MGFALIVQTILMITLAVIIQPRTTANVHNYLSGRGHDVLEETIGTLEILDVERFLSDPEGKLRIIVTYGDLESKTLGVAMRGESTCRIVISPVLNPETSISYDDNDLKSVLAHEIGHCFGMDHFKDENHVMFWSYDGEPHNYDKLQKFVEDLKKFREPFFL